MHGEMSHGVVPGHMMVSAIVVVCHPESRASLIVQIDALPWAEVRHTDEEGRMVVVVEAEDTEQSMERAKQLQGLPRVLSAELGGYYLDE